MLSGDNSILSRTGQARDDAVITRENEQIKLAVNSSIIDELGEKANAKGVRKYFKAQGDKVSVYQNEDEIEIEYLDTGHKYIVKANGEIVKQEGTDTEEKKVYYKIDGTTLYLSCTKKDDNYKETEDYYFNNIDDIKLPEWIGEITTNEAGNKVWPISPIEKVVVENRIRPKNTSCWFIQCKNLNKIENIGRLDTKDTTDMGYMFYNCTSLKSLDVTSLDVSNFNISNVTDIGGMFYYCSSLTSIDVSSFNTSNVTNMGGMFYNCSSLTSMDVSSFNTGNVTNMSGMFNSCTSLTSIDVSSFNTSNVINMGGMFNFCRKLEQLDLSNFDTSKVTNMLWMFNECNALTQLNLAGFNTSNVTDMSYMFNTLKVLKTLDISSFDTKNVTNFKRIFNGSTSLSKIYVGDNWNTGKNTGESIYVFPGNCRLPNFNKSNDAYRDIKWAYVGEGGYLSKK